MGSLISPENDFAIWAVLIGIAGFGFWCERYPFGRKYSGVMLLITLAIVLSNLRIIPTSAPAYDAVWTYLVPVAIPLLLFQADMRRIFAEAGRTLVAFVIGAAGVVIGVYLAVALIDLGEHEAALGGIFTGTYIGGSLNFAAIAEVTQFPDESLLIAAVAADNVITNLHVLLIILLPSIVAVARFFPVYRGAVGGSAAAADDEPVHRIADFDVPGLLYALALAFALASAGIWTAANANEFVASITGNDELRDADWSSYAILITTLFALLIATFGKRIVAGLSGYSEAGNALLFIFLAMVGASADIWRLVETAPILFLFALIIVSVHMLVLLPVGRLLRLDLAEMCIASAVCIGGPASGPAIAAAKGWKDLVIPGVLAGSFGYAVGSFIGTAVYRWLL